MIQRRHECEPVQYVLDDIELDWSTVALNCLRLRFSYSAIRVPSSWPREIVHPTTWRHSPWCTIVCSQMSSIYSLLLSVSLMGFLQFTAHNLCLFCSINFTVSTLRGLSIRASLTLTPSQLYLSLPLDDNISCNVDFMRGN